MSAYSEAGEPRQLAATVAGADAEEEPADVLSPEAGETAYKLAAIARLESLLAGSTPMETKMAWARLLTEADEVEDWDAVATALESEGVSITGGNLDEALNGPKGAQLLADAARLVGE
ncbi:MAG: hypothetical protein UY92_C0010G0033 [Candidatus Magasanikbacteria bacterium GW2011_GWA2_56_11]|uniref:Uncharacterized protein n=1 Tax=Candidatus Magasanikbacteria bacterium GW2011_GWA2_56_11 TaxID=1619044 RepID=A0A0G2ALF9_9BACT|nr:MAG: hypothetical protein UY92_C0010G0033 [Candidatus Magasanikbacteria bacterium GW2011_GWA2_56_11]